MKKILFLVTFITLSAAFVYRDLLPDYIPFESWAFRGAETPTELKTFYENYYQEKRARGAMKLFCMDNLSSSAWKSEYQKMKDNFGEKIISLKAELLDQRSRDFFNKKVTVNGQPVCYNLHIEGQLLAVFEGGRASALLFGKKDGKYYFSAQITG